MNADLERMAAGLFQAALEHPPEKRPAFIEAVCGENAELRKRVVELLTADIGASAILAPLPPPDATAASGGAEAAALPTESIPGYQIVGEVHRGGQGVVYQAIHKTTRRKVAIKLMREGPFAGSTDRARFEREVQVLGQLNHPNIVAIHDTGVAAGCHYFVMDYVGGQTLDRWMTDRPRSIEEILGVFAEICDAVNAAHLRGVIHRDLKPGNIRIDDGGRPHILDFGLAKVIAPTGERDYTALPPMTVTGQFLGSLPWAAPEQAEGQPTKIDIRTDVYSLGVILYQLLTGKFPYEIVGNMRDVLDRIQRAVPARPSTVQRRINDEVETIVLKCLQKERERRYQSAGELGRDVRHYLAGEPIAAKRDSFAYVVRKQLRRHLAATLVAGTIVSLAAAGGISASILWRQTARARDAAAAAFRAETRHAAIARAVNGFVQEMLAAADPASAGERRELSVREVLDAAARRIEGGALRDEPAVEAGVRHAIGRTYHSLGLLVEAEPHLQRALELRETHLDSQPLDVAESLSQLALLRMDQGALEGAQELQERALRLVLAGSRPTGVEEARCRNNLGSVLWLRGRFDDAAREFQLAETLYAAMAAENAAIRRDRASCRNNSGALAHARGDLAAAERDYRAALELRRGIVAGPHPDVANSLQNLAAVLNDAGRPADAEALLREAERIGVAVYPSDHPALAGICAQLARLLREQGRDAEALDFARRAQAAFELRPREASPARAESRNEQGHLLWNGGRLAEAAIAFREALLLYQAAPAARVRDVAIAMNNLAGVLSELGQHDEAGRLIGRALRLVESPPPEDDISIAAVCHTAALVHAANGEAAAALPFAERALRMRLAALAPDDWRIANARSVLGSILGDLGYQAEGERLLVAGYEGLAAQPLVAPRFIAAARHRLVRFYERANRVEDANCWRAKGQSASAPAGP